MPELAGFRLCGGTSLALQIGHRVSVDLDFFTPDPVQYGPLIEVLGVDFQFLENYETQKIMSCYLNGVKVDFVHYTYPWLYVPVHEDGIELCSLQDIGAMKLEAIKGRGRKRDFVDLYFLLQVFSLAKLMEFNKLKFNNADLSLILKSLTYFADAEGDDDLKMHKKLSWTKVKDTISKSVFHYIKAL